MQMKISFMFRDVFFSFWVQNFSPFRNSRTLRFVLYLDQKKIENSYSGFQIKEILIVATENHYHFWRNNNNGFKHSKKDSMFPTKRQRMTPKFTRFSSDEGPPDEKSSNSSCGTFLFIFSHIINPIQLMYVQ